jgi:GMP synthase (glutamine-hydrolysing)
MTSVKESPLLKGLSATGQVWMSHGDTIMELPSEYELIGSTETVRVAAFAHTSKPIFGIQFHPEVTHSTEGSQLIKNFIVDICGCAQTWTSDSFVDRTVSELQAKLGNDKVVLGLSGGVDSSVAAVLLHRAIGKNLYCIFVDNGLLRKDEFEQVLESYNTLGLNVKGVNSKQRFYDALKGLTDPEDKRKAIGI